MRRFITQFTTMVFFAMTILSGYAVEETGSFFLKEFDVVNMLMADEQKDAGVLLSPSSFTLMKSENPCYACADKESDSIFLHNSKAVVFELRRTRMQEQYVRYIMDSLAMMVADSSKYRKICVRASSSPEGPAYLNEMLSINRYKAVKSYFKHIGIPDNKLSFEVIGEDYRMLYQLMRENKDADLSTVINLMNKYGDNTEGLKAALQKANGGQLWKRLSREYFPELRATRFMVIENGKPVTEPDVEPASEEQKVETPVAEQPKPEVVPLPEDSWEVETETVYHREKWSVKTNLLFYGAYVPQYGFAPIPNVAIEYYPLHGHWTFGASLDFPWWVGTTENHKYFQLRNYQVEARRYFKSGDVAKTGVGNGKAFKGLYLQAYAHAFLYGIGFSASKGWQGEGAGAGVGLGYVVPLGKTSRWSLELGAQFGGFITKYDPYQYGCPVENSVDGLYYYKWTGSADLFRKRQYQYTYFGPTRIGVTLTYNLLYRRNNMLRQPASGFGVKKVTLKKRSLFSKLVKVKK